MRVAFLLLVLAAGSAAAQTAPEPGSCALGTSQANLDVNNVAARVFNTGSLFYGNATTDGYEVPQGSGNTAIFASGLWVGGRVGGELRVAGGTYGPSPGMDFTFWPGPLNAATGQPVNPTDCSAYDRIYSVARADIAAYDATGTATADLAGWPADLGAPVIDGDGVPGNYNLAGGDRPDIVGDQGVWWVMNDVGNVHAELSTPPLGIEVQVLAFSFARPDALGDATFYKYRIINKSGADIVDAYVSVFSDPDLGGVQGSTDDFIGSDTDAGLGYVYNADNADGNGSGSSYGTPPPALGYDFLQGPTVLDGDDDGTDPDTLSTSAFSYFVGSPDGAGDPDNGEELYNYQQGLWGDGSVMRAFGDGYQETQGAVTTFAFSGDPAMDQPWSEVNTGTGTNAGGDRRFAIHTGPFTLANGEAQDVVLGIVFAQGTDNLTSVTALRAASRMVQSAYDAEFVVAGEGAPSGDIALGRPAPNPFTAETRVSVGGASGAAVRAVLFDVLGREVGVVHDGPLGGDLRVPGAGLTPGVYLLRVRTASGEQTVRIVRR